MACAAITKGPILRTLYRVCITFSVSGWRFLFDKLLLRLAKPSHFGIKRIIKHFWKRWSKRIFFRLKNSGKNGSRVWRHVDNSGVSSGLYCFIAVVVLLQWNLKKTAVMDRLKEVDHKTISVSFTIYIIIRFMSDIWTTVCTHSIHVVYTVYTNKLLTNC